MKKIQSNSFMRIFTLFAIGCFIAACSACISMLGLSGLIDYNTSYSFISKYLTSIEWVILFIIGNQFCYCMGRNIIQMVPSLLLGIIGAIIFALLSIATGSSLADFFTVTSHKIYYAISIIGILINFGTYCLGLHSSIMISRKITGYEVRFK